MAEENPLLTISLLSSGRSGTVERCLSSLAPFKEQIPTEILVVDTDSEHRRDVRGVLERYADRIIPFDWCDDFSVARNVSVDAAKGKWYLFIDDDEWFIDAQPIIDFLLSDDAKQCHWANHRRRDYYSADYVKYMDTWVTRLFRLDGKTRFRAKIHEYPHPLRGDGRNIEALSGHSGYIYQTNEERLAHSRRNMSLLERLAQEEPNEARWVFQLILEYASLGDSEKELAYSQKGYEMMRGAKGYRYACVRGFFAANILRRLREDGDARGCYAMYRKIRRDGAKFGKKSHAYMETEAGQAAYMLGEKSKSRQHFNRYLDAYEKYKDMTAECAEEDLHFLMDTFGDRVHTFVLTSLIRIGLDEEDWEPYETYFADIEWDDGGRFDFAEYAEQLTGVAARRAYDAHFADMISVFWKYPATRRAVQEKLLDLEKLCRVHDAEESDGKENAYWNLVRAIAEADISGADPLDIRIIWDDYCGNRARMPEYYRRLSAAVNPLILEPRLWEIGLRRGAVLDERIREIPFGRWQVYVEEFVKESSPTVVRDVADIIERVYLGSRDEWHDYFAVRAAEKLDIHREALSQISTQQEMKQIIDALQDKVDELVSAGMIEEADRVLKEIQKYTDMM